MPTSFPSIKNYAEPKFLTIVRNVTNWRDFLLRSRSWTTLTFLFQQVLSFCEMVQLFKWKGQQMPEEHLVFSGCVCVASLRCDVVKFEIYGI